MTEEFRKGARAMFDHWLYRAANHWHGNPAVDKICQEENKLINEWAIDALAEVSPDDGFTWKALNDPEGVIEKSRRDRAEIQHVWDLWNDSTALSADEALCLVATILQLRFKVKENRS